MNFDQLPSETRDEIKSIANDFAEDDERIEGEIRVLKIEQAKRRRQYQTRIVSLWPDLVGSVQRIRNRGRTELVYVQYVILKKQPFGVALLLYGQNALKNGKPGKQTKKRFITLLHK